MRGFLCLAIAVTASCGRDGVHFEVVVPDGMPAERVDLFLAKGSSCKLPSGAQCTGIAPPRIDPNTAREAVDGLVFEEDAIEPLQADVEDGSAWFFLAPGPGKVKAVIAIGHDAQGADIGALVVTNPIVLDDGDQYLAAELVPVGARLGEGTPAAEQWPRGGMPYSCAGAQLGDQPAVFIVPKDDPDCDHVAAAAECAPTTFQAQEAASSELVEMTCVAAPEGACELGDQACDEVGATASTACVTPPDTRYCVPDFACDQCPMLDPSCAQQFVDSLGTGTEVTHIECRFATEAVGGEVRVCAGLSTPAELSPINHGQCAGNVAIADFSFDFTQFDTSFFLDPITLQPKVANAPDCQFALQASSDLFAADQFGLQTLLVEIETVPAQRQTFTLLPLIVEFGQPNDCNMEASTCKLVLAAGDKLETCLP